MSDSRSIWLSANANRDAARNEGTRVVSIDLFGPSEWTLSGRTGSIAVSAASFEEVFIRNYARIRAAVAGRDQSGVVVIAASGDDVYGELWLSAEKGLQTAIVGRHGRADLFVPNDPGLSLRHAAVLVDRVDERTRVRVMDLRSEAGIRDELDRAFGAVEADGPLLLTASRLRLFVIPTPATAPWPDDPASGWDALPPRNFLEERPAGPRPVADSAGSRSLARSSARLRAGSREVTVTMSPGPIGAEFESLLAPGEEPLGKLTLSAHWDAEITIGPSAAARGVLIGRYERCDGAGLAAMRENALSRVHALVVEAGGELRVIDTASTNGTWREGRLVRCEPLVPGEEYSLANLPLRWTPAT